MKKIDYRDYKNWLQGGFFRGVAWVNNIEELIDYVKK